MLRLVPTFPNALARHTQVASLLLASPFLFLLGHADTRTLLLAALILFGLGRGFYDCNTMPVLCQVARDDLHSTGYGIFNFAGCLVGGGGGRAGGRFEKRHRVGRSISNRGGDSMLVGLAPAAHRSTISAKRRGFSGAGRRLDRCLALAAR